MLTLFWEELENTGSFFLLTSSGRVLYDKERPISRRGQEGRYTEARETAY